MSHLHANVVRAAYTANALEKRQEISRQFIDRVLVLLGEKMLVKEHQLEFSLVVPLLPEEADLFGVSNQSNNKIFNSLSYFANSLKGEEEKVNTQFQAVGRYFTDLGYIVLLDDSEKTFILK